ncbi:amidohydrolase family protein [Klebsiella quasipneumoniae]|uniref:amidohydrolase family protein n=1 Tax=Klebsiella quasipneumoniae TaxID=1463165 RepID=UPI002D803420|nr:amidohydrolase family protein [Klebsiella quasipneumoniae]MEB4699635.1 amidohydrolase family protein [Klebsiella quasipneumoniae]HBS1665559.1 amidohydrolase family protein [Klebsiella quasipneumoniae subsp. quasipneumoniae]
MSEHELAAVLGGKGYGACDSHVHLFMPDIFSYNRDRRYTPGSATLLDLAAHNEILGVTHTVLVQPSCYGNDNRALCYGLSVLGSEYARGVVVIDIDNISDEELRVLHLKGVRGIRLNLSVSGQGDIARIRAEMDCATQRIGPMGWHIQIFASPTQLALLLPLIRDCKVPVVLDHYAGGAAMAEQITELLERPNIWIKLSAPSRVSTTPDFTDLASVVARFAEVAPDRLVWASDWPHTGGHGRRSSSIENIEPFAAIDDRQDLHRLAWWIDNSELFRRILTTNAYRLYDF